MSLIVVEGLDRVGKSSMAKIFEKDGYEIIHMSAPPKGQTADDFLQEMMDIIHRAASSNIFLDRSYYGEALVWPQIYGRDSLLNEEGLEILRELEDSVGVRRILMHDPEVEKHWQRCVDNKEPLTRPQFLRARVAYERLANKYGFEKTVLTDLPAFKDKKQLKEVVAPLKIEAVNDKYEITIAIDGKTKEQLKLEKANAINDVLSKKIIKGKGQMFDEIETEVRSFLNKKLGTILGTGDTGDLSQDEIHILKTFVKRIKEKES